ncbi:MULTISPECIES: sensor histidine kinase [Nocardia]|uniref:sensor histidine kinase n=1 Tax=Nocardia TaxID=1817 RepID=UPI000BF1EAEC|nr:MULTISPECIES: sensor histidine kinase [Nocardia]MBF6067874.1 sensor domain-containing protein [Nocardia farcinica]MBF6184664.1 sensor domain-containing protein [Nocardia farcinica]MBF6310508.1 sensor domain-containing protein [Nocardia farcinica]MBF6405673.1 sensor domain-containing protein [Nocardia farcinica]PEH75336.1 histidine kinase [Nocardia sp. FDAARGOS_372]
MTETSTEPTLVLDRPVAPLPPPRRTVPAVLRAPVEARTWKELVYLVTAFALGCVAVCWVFFGIGGGLYLSVLVVGVPVLALVLLGGRVWGAIYRGLAEHLLDTTVPAPPEFAPPRGFLGFLRGAFTDRVSWRALLFLLAQAIVGVVLGYLVLTAVAVAVFTALSPIPWALFDPVNVDENGVARHSLMQFGSFYVDTWPRVLGVAAVGVLACFAVPWLVRGVCLLHRMLTVALLAETTRDRQLAELRESRRAAVEDAAATLRRVERDLHDGTQARLVTIAMALGRAEERLAAGGDARDLIADAHASSKEALTELRELVRGIHPPALELGLGPALETLTARCAVPVELRVHLPRRPSPAVEAIAYFSVAELLTNVVKHARAERAWVSVLPDSIRTLAVTVRDNGIGGVLPPAEGASSAGSGLAGLAARARAVDGSLTVASPLGGPTVVTIVLPLEDPQ